MSYLNDNYNKIFKKYSNEQLIADIDNYIYGKGRLYKVLNNFFEECMFKCCGKRTKISPYDVLNNDDKMNIVLQYIKSKPKFFTSDDEVANVKSCLRNSLSWVRKVANFPCREARDIYFRYFDNAKGLNCLDTSAGFGSRMSAVLLSNSNYYGIDPNKELIDKLNQYNDFLHDINVTSGKCKLYCTGSEVFIEELVDKIDVYFTSPPYFNLETYSNDNNSSSKNYDNYEKWLSMYVKPTIYNAYKYLKVGGYAMINIKNIDGKHKLFDDWFNIFMQLEGFDYVETFDFKINKKQYGLKYDNTKGEIKNQEPVMVFKKVK